MKKFLPFLILVFLITLTGVSIYNLNKQQVNATSANLDNSDSEVKRDDEINIHFSKANIELPDFSLPNLYDENATFSKQDLIGHYSIINIFASWCTTCHAEHPILLRLQDEKIIDVYGIAWRDIDDNTKHFLQKNGNPFNLVATDSKAVFSKFINLMSVPETLIIDPKGTVVMRYRGNLQEFSINEIKRFLQSKH